MRVPEDDEVAGIDQAEHAETAYDFSGAGGGTSRSASVPAAPVAAQAESEKVDA
jgi:Amt family ammonium transporter